MKNMSFLAALAAMFAAATVAAGCHSPAAVTSYGVVEDDGWFAVSPAVPTVRVAAENENAKKAVGRVRVIASPDTPQGFAGAEPTGWPEFSYELLPPVFDETKKVALEAGGSAETVFELVLPGPGFYRCLVIADGRDTLKSFNVGLNPERIVSPADAADDFDEFWRTARAELDTTSAQWKITPLPDSSSVARAVYLVEGRSLDGETISGFYARPNKKGKHPAIIHYRGYGSKPWCFDPDAEPDYAEFVLFVRGQGLNEPNNKYGDWITYGLEDKNRYYYRGAFMDLVRAVDFVASREEVDGRFIFACGGSQGGAFTLVAAALDGRIAGAAPTIPFLSDYREYFKIVHWPAQPVENRRRELGLTEEKMLETLSYFDVKNFAPKISCPVIMGFGLQDGVCPPRSNFAGYNLITAPKEYRCYPQAGHWTGADWDDRRKEFFERIMAERGAK